MLAQTLCTYSLSVICVHPIKALCYNVHQAFSKSVQPRVPVLVRGTLVGSTNTSLGYTGLGYIVATGELGCGPKSAGLQAFLVPG